MTIIPRYVSAFGCSVAGHVGVVLVLVWLTTDRLPRITTETAPPPAMAAFVVPPEDSKYPGLKPLDPGATARIQALDDQSAQISLPGFTFDAAKLFERAAVLFPFVSPGLSLDHFAINPGEERALVYEKPASETTRRDRGAATEPLMMSDAALQALIDRAWSRRERWRAFEPVRVLAARYSPDAGGMPLVFQRYTDQNALQPYQDTVIHDPRFWTQLGLAADHVQFIGFIRQYCAAHSGTRGAIELLFLLDRIAEASQDALETLLASNPEQDLRWTRNTNRQAYRLALQLRVHYRAVLSNQGIHSSAAATLYYERVRLAILKGILQTTPNGYRANDARFLIGAINWRQGNRAAALAAWHDLGVEPGDSYITANSQIAATLRAAAADPNDANLARQINRILRNEQGRWVDLSYDRLKRFGYRFDTY